MTRAYVAICCLFGLAIAVATWMLGYSLILLLVWKDGRIFHLMISSDPLAPIRQLLVYADRRPVRLAAAWSLLPAACAAAAISFLALRKPANPLGDAAFQDRASLRRGGWMRAKGHVFGRFGRDILRCADERHHLIIGPTRSGKGVGYVIPNALMHRGSMIVTDLKGEIFDLTAGYRASTGNAVYLFSPGSEKSHRWNPLDFVRTDRGSRTIDIQNMAAILIPETTGSDNAIWQGTAQQVIAGLISYVLESPRYHGRRTLGEVNGLFNAGVDLQQMMAQIKKDEPGLSRFTTDSFNAYVALNENAARSALLDIQKAMAPFRNERVTAATAVTDMDLASMRRRPVSIYLAPNITDMTILRPLLTLFVQQVMDLLTREHDRNALPVYFLLDEFRQLKRMDEVLTKLPFVAGYNIKLAFVIQGLKSLDEIYGETARHSLLGNCGLQLIFGANDQVTADYASRALGKRTIRYQSETRALNGFGAARRTRVEQIRERDLMMPQEIRTMPDTRLILLIEGQRPILGQKLRYYATEPFRKASEIAKARRVVVPDVELTVSGLAGPLPGKRIREEPASAEERGGGADQPRSEMAVPERIANAVVTAVAADLTPPNRPMKSGAERLVGDAAPEENFRASARRLKSAVAATLSAAPDMSVKRRRSIADVLAATIPDPADIGFD